MTAIGKARSARHVLYLLTIQSFKRVRGAPEMKLLTVQIVPYLPWVDRVFVKSAGMALASLFKG